MRLHDLLVRGMETMCECHPYWHLARLPDRYFTSPEARKALNEARRACEECCTKPIPIDQPGSGEEFLKFHREMLRNFKWICDHPEDYIDGHTDHHDLTVAERELEKKPWTKIPDEVAAELADLVDDPDHRGAYLKAAEERIDHLVQFGTLDELGSFIESTDMVAPDVEGYNLHNRLHAAIGRLEPELIGTDADMTDAGKGFRNSLFYKLHGWIDGFYAAWQVKNGETVEDGPLEPESEDTDPAQDGHHHHATGAPVTVTMPGGAPTPSPVSP